MRHNAEGGVESLNMHAVDMVVMLAEFMQSPLRTCTLSLAVMLQLHVFQCRGRNASQKRRFDSKKKMQEQYAVFDQSACTCCVGWPHDYGTSGTRVITVL